MQLPEQAKPVAACPHLLRTFRFESGYGGLSVQPAGAEVIWIDQCHAATTRCSYVASGSVCSLAPDGRPGFERPNLEQARLLVGTNGEGAGEGDDASVPLSLNSAAQRATSPPFPLGARPEAEVCLPVRTERGHYRTNSRSGTATPRCSSSESESLPLPTPHA